MVPWGVGVVLAVWCVIALAEFYALDAQWFRWLSQWGLTPVAHSSGVGAGLFATDHTAKLLSGFCGQFFHADALHLLGNSAYFLVFGIQVERVLGGLWLIVLTVVLGTVALVLPMLWWAPVDAVVIGASGAISGLLGLSLVLKPTDKMGLWLPLGVVPQFVVVPTWLIIASWLVVQLIFLANAPNYPEIAGSVHVVGFVSGVVLGLMARWARQQRRTR